VKRRARAPDQKQAVKEGKGKTSRGTDRNVQTNICSLVASTLSRGYNTWVSSLLPRVRRCTSNSQTVAEEQMRKVPS